MTAAALSVGGTPVSPRPPQKVRVPDAQEPRPIHRSDCLDTARPCPHVGCKHHLWLASTGSASRPDRQRFSIAASAAQPAARRGQPWTWTDDELAASLGSMPWTCALDFVSEHDDGAPLATIGAVLGLTRQRVEQIEAKALRKLARAVRANDARSNVNPPLRAVSTATPTRGHPSNETRSAGQPGTSKRQQIIQSDDNSTSAEAGC